MIVAIDDLISRQDAIEAMAELQGKATSKSELLGISKAWKRIKALPSAQLERKGYWIEMGTNKDGTHSIRCSKCGEGYKARGYAWSITTKAKYKFCPNCGADMRDEQEK